MLASAFAAHIHKHCARYMTKLQVLKMAFITKYSNANIFAPRLYCDILIYIHILMYLCVMFRVMILAMFCACGWYVHLGPSSTKIQALETGQSLRLRGTFPTASSLRT